MKDGNSDEKTARVLMEKGFTPAPANEPIAQDGFTPALGVLGSPPTQGSAVFKPAEAKKD